MQAVDELWQLPTHLRSISDIYSNISSPDNPLPNPHSNSSLVLSPPSRFFQILCVILWRFSLTKRWKTISFSISSRRACCEKSFSFFVSFIAFKLTFAFRISNSTVCYIKFQFIAFYFSPKYQKRKINKIVNKIFETSLRIHSMIRSVNELRLCRKTQKNFISSQSFDWFLFYIMYEQEQNQKQCSAPGAQCGARLTRWP